MRQFVAKGKAETASGRSAGKASTDEAKTKGGNEMKHRRQMIWAYADRKKLVEVIQAALDNNMTVREMKALLIKENPNSEVTFKVV